MNEHAWIDPRKIAAVVYDDGVAVDELLLAFAGNLTETGHCLGGVVQVPRGGPGCGPKAPMALRDVASGEVFPICQELGPGGHDCALDPARLWEAAERIRTAAERNVDLVFVSRFGREEARGRGLRDALAAAALSGRPTLTAVRREMVDNWLSFSDGVGTLLEARLWVLEDWWRDLARTARKAA
jgi:molybdate transport system ATP-binding protein